MMSIVDSTEHLVQRASEVGLSPGGLASLGRHGFATLGKLAFSHGQPGMQIEAGPLHRYAQNSIRCWMQPHRYMNRSS